MPHRIVIVGGGAGGLELATRLGRSLGKADQAMVVLVDANLTHLWKPLLHEVSAGSLNAAEEELNYVAQGKWNHFEFQLGTLCGLERATRSIRLAALLDDSGAELVPIRTLHYDSLIIAVGSTTNDFGTPGAAQHCLFLDSPKEAERLHRMLLNCYLSAHARSGDAGEFGVAIVGAGATGVELAAELRHAAIELAAYGLSGIKPNQMRITLLDAAPRVLPALDEHIAASVQKTLALLDVDVITSAPVAEVSADGLRTADGRFIPATLKVWAAGIRAPGLLANLDGLATNPINQLLVRPTLQTTLDENIFAFGDCAACPRGDGEPGNVPPRAQAAHQQASLLATSLQRHLRGAPLRDYRYHDHGSLISLSRFTTVGQMMGKPWRSVKLEGWLARLFYISLYRMHQQVLYGVLRTGLLMLGDRIRRNTRPRLKLH